MMQGLHPQTLKLARMERGLTLRQAAELAGVAKETISELERGKRSPHPPTIYKIARGYGIPVRNLLDPSLMEGTPPKALAPESVPADSAEEEEISEEDKRREILDLAHNTYLRYREEVANFEKLDEARREEIFSSLFFAAATLKNSVVAEVDPAKTDADAWNLSELLLQAAQNALAAWPGRDETAIDGFVVDMSQYRQRQAG